MDSGKVPWPKLREYLLRVSSCSTPKEFMRTACLEVQTLVPFDVTAGIFNASDARYLEGVGQSDAVNESYNTYYRTRQPSFLKDDGRVDLGGILSTHVLDCRKYSNLEFASDFMLPNRMCKALSNALSEHKITLAIHRSRTSSDFTEADVDTLGIVNDYLNNLYPNFAKKGNAPDLTLSAEGIAEKFRSLSKREAEICSLVARRFNTAEISTSLFISRRTVEKHLESIFDKLDVRSRDQLRWKLGVTPTTGLRQPSIGRKSPQIT